MKLLISLILVISAAVSSASVYNQQIICKQDGVVQVVLYTDLNKEKGLVFVGKEGSEYDRQIFEVEILETTEKKTVAIANFTWMNNDVEVYNKIIFTFCSKDSRCPSTMENIMTVEGQPHTNTKNMSCEK